MRLKGLIFFCLFLLSTIVYSQKVISLYTESIPNAVGLVKEADKPTLTVYQPSKKKANGYAVIIMPGGSYSFHATDTEGTPIAKVFADSGYTAFVLKYRLPKDSVMLDKAIVPLQDAQRAIQLVKERASQWGLRANRVGIVGFSAGGHLASTLCTHFNTAYIPNPKEISLRPAFMILVYPVISMENKLTHAGSRKKLIGNKPSEDSVRFFSSEMNVNWQTPPTYLTHASDDEVVNVENSIAFYRALAKEKIQAELHIFPEGNHGFIQRLPVTDWFGPIQKFIKSIWLL